MTRRLLAFFTFTAACPTLLNLGTDTHLTRIGIYASADCTGQIPARMVGSAVVEVIVATEFMAKQFYLCYDREEDIR